VRRFGWVIAAAAVPLVALLGLQYHWMRELERTSAIVEEATLDNYLEALTADVEVFYRTEGERALNLPAALFSNGPEHLRKAAYYFKQKGWVSARRLFVVGLAGEHAGWVHYYDPKKTSLYEPPLDAESRAVAVAVAPWKTLAHKDGKLGAPALAVDERDPAYRMLINPITDESSRLVGLAGMILDAQHFEKKVLPAAVKKSLPAVSSERYRKPPVVIARDGTGRELCFGADAKGLPAGPDDVSGRLGFVFADWEIGLRGRHETPGSWARRNFQLNLALSGVLALAVVGGIGFALRSAAREMKLSAMKSEFVSNVSHELRTPLASIRVFGELLRLGRVESPEKAREYGEFIETESRRLTQLINNILDFSRIESGRREYRFENADLAAVVEETLRTFRPSLEQAGFKLGFQPADLPPVTIDPAAIAQAVGNLLDNAVKYSNGARAIDVALRREGDWAVVSVRDRGIGVPREEQKKIFERFHRVPTGLVHDVKGSGLGLAIVRHIVAAHHGRVEVESEAGQGSTFSLYLPCDRPWPAS
jgi:signal transduction histidine kinase